MASIISLSEIQRIRQQIETLRRELQEKEQLQERGWLELAQMKRAVRAGGGSDPDSHEVLTLQQEHGVLLRKVRDMEAAVNRAKEKVAAHNSVEERHTAEIKQKEADLKRLEGEVIRLREGAARGERGLAEMEHRLRQARERPIA